MIVRELKQILDKAEEQDLDKPVAIAADLTKPKPHNIGIINDGIRAKFHHGRFRIGNFD
jgi:hypothetical protein